MNDAIKMQLSAFVDGELPSAEAELLTRRLGQDAVLRQQAAQYLEIGRLVRGERTVSGIAGLSERVAVALEQEAPLKSDESSTMPTRWLRPAAGVAIAASVALLALTGLRQLDVQDTVATPPLGTAQLTDRADAYTEPLAIDVMDDRPGDLLMQYYLSHGDTSGELGANGILSRLVTLELRGGELVEVVPAGDAELESEAPGNDNDPSDSAKDP